MLFLLIPLSCIPMYFVRIPDSQGARNCLSLRKSLIYTLPRIAINNLFKHLMLPTLSLLWFT